MKQDWDEQQIKALFHELRRQDERGAPSFASIWEAAVLHAGEARPRRRLSRVAAVTVMLMALGGSVAVFLRHAARQPAPTRTPGSVGYLSDSPAPTVPPASPPGEERPKAIERPPSPARSPQSARLISQWRPPTDFLLKTPGEQWLRAVPRLGESVVDLEALKPDYKKLKRRK